MTRSWKASERTLAAMLGGERVPVSGRTRGWAPDISHRWLALEVKTRKNMPVLLREGMDQAVKSAAWAEKRGEGSKLPMLLIHQDHSDYDNTIVCVRLKDARAWWGIGEESKNGA